MNTCEAFEADNYSARCSAALLAPSQIISKVSEKERESPTEKSRGWRGGGLGVEPDVMRVKGGKCNHAACLLDPSTFPIKR